MKCYAGFTVSRRRLQRARTNSRQGSGAGQHYHIEIQTDDSGEKALAITWEQRPVANTLLTEPGIYCLRSNELKWDETTFWRTYIMLTDLEGVFRSLREPAANKLPDLFTRRHGEFSGFSRGRVGVGYPFKAGQMPEYGGRKTEDGWMKSNSPGVAPPGYRYRTSLGFGGYQPQWGGASPHLICTAPLALSSAGVMPGIMTVSH